MKTTMRILVLVAVVFLNSTGQLLMAQKIDRTVRKEARKLRKEGYFVMPGTLPLKQQLVRAYAMEKEYDGANNPKYFLASGSAVAQTKAAAMAHAVENAKVSMANQVKSQVLGLIKTDLANRQFTEKKAKSITKNISVYIDVVSVHFGRLLPVMVLYRKSGRNIEANIRLAYDASKAIKEVKDAVIEELEKETDIARDQLESFFSKIETTSIN